MVTVIQEHFELLNFADSTFGAARINDTSISVHVSGVQAHKEYPLALQRRPLSGTLNFSQVISSRRCLIEYIGDPKNPAGFKEPYEITDMISDVNLRWAVHEYALEGYLLEPSAWIESWIIMAGHFEFVID